MENEKHEISTNTCAISYKEEEKCTIIEGKEKIDVDMNLQDYLNYNCEYYGSSFEGRHKGSQSILGMKYKLPIIIEESKEIVFFPTKAYNHIECAWISLHNITSYEQSSHSTIVTFNSGIKAKYNISLESFENQLIRANKLLLILKNRKQG